VRNGHQVLDDRGRTLMLAGIQTPFADRYHHRAHINTATQALRRLITAHQPVRVRFVGRTPDRWGRCLIDLYGHNGIWIQAEMLRAGMAYAAPHRRFPLLLTIEKQARTRNAGLWRSAEFAVKSPGMAALHLNTYQIVEGTVRAVTQRGTLYYLDLSPDGISARLAAPTLAEIIADPQALVGRTIRVRGVVFRQHTATVHLTDSALLELLPELSPLGVP
jgi:hypothetical protein